MRNAPIGFIHETANAMNITHGLRRALQVKSCGTATIFEGRRRTWQEIGDRVSRFAGALHAHPLGRGESLHRLALGVDAQPVAALLTGRDAVVGDGLGSVTGTTTFLTAAYLRPLF